MSAETSGPEVHSGEAGGDDHQPELRLALDELRRLVEVAASYPELSEPLALSRTVTCFRLQEDPALSLTVMLDREPVEAVEGDAVQAESEVMIGAEDLLAFTRGELRLPIAIAKGRVSYQGRVRKFLRATPILRRAARLHAEPERAEP